MNKKYLIIIFSILLISIISFFIIRYNSINEICIMLNGKDVTSKYLEDAILSDTIPTYITIKNSEDYNTIEVYKNKIKCIDSNCKNKLCIKTGQINSFFNNNMIVCLPHELIIFFK